jgi:hypothetical protein
MSGEAACSSADTQWTTRDEQISSNSKDPTHNNHNSDSTSSEDEMEGQGDFAANWYEPLPQDPRESDEEEEGEEREQQSEAAIGSGQPPLQGKQDGEREEEEGEGQGASVQRVEGIQAASLLEDSELEIILLTIYINYLKFPLHYYPMKILYHQSKKYNNYVGNNDMICFLSMIRSSGGNQTCNGRVLPTPRLTTSVGPRGSRKRLEGGAYRRTATQTKT